MWTIQRHKTYLVSHVAFFKTAASFYFIFPHLFLLFLETLDIYDIVKFEYKQYRVHVYLTISSFFIIIYFSACT